MSNEQGFDKMVNSPRLETSQKPELNGYIKLTGTGEKSLGQQKMEGRIEVTGSLNALLGAKLSIPFLLFTFLWLDLCHL